MKLKLIVGRMLKMCPIAWYIFKRTLQLCCFILIGACILLIAAEGSAKGSYEMYMTAVSLNEICQALLLIAVLFSVIIEDVQT